MGNPRLSNITTPFSLILSSHVYLQYISDRYSVRHDFYLFHLLPELGRAKEVSGALHIVYVLLPAACDHGHREVCFPKKPYDVYGKNTILTIDRNTRDLDTLFVRYNKAPLHPCPIPIS